MAVSRRVTRGGPPVFNVKTFGAVGDGTTNDTAAIQAAIDAATAQTYYATVFLPFGFYKITSPLVITRPIKLLGEGCVVGDRLKNNQYSARGAVIWNASTTGNAIEFRPSTIAGLWPRGLGGMIFQDFGIDTPELGGAAVSTSDPSGWGPLSTGRGIACYALASSPYKIPYYCQYRNVTVCRHSIGFDLNASGANAYYSGSHDFSWCNALLCRDIGFNLSAVESRLEFCRAKCNDPEWSSTGGAYGFYLAADGSFLSHCITIKTTIGYYGKAESSGDSNGIHILTGCGADQCGQGFDFSAITSWPVQIANCWTSNALWSSDPAFKMGQYGLLSNCRNFYGVGFNVTGGSVDGGEFLSGTATGDTSITGVRVQGALTRSSYTGSVSGGKLGSVAGSAGTSKGRGITGVSDWG